MLAWSPEESAKIIENYKIYENKPPDRIMEKIENDPHQKVVRHISQYIATSFKCQNDNYMMLKMFLFIVIITRNYVFSNNNLIIVSRICI